MENAPFISILDELEQWEAFLKVEPEVIYKLRAFEKAANAEEKAELGARSSQLHRRGPSL